MRGARTHGSGVVGPVDEKRTRAKRKWKTPMVGLFISIINNININVNININIMQSPSLLHLLMIGKTWSWCDFDFQRVASLHTNSTYKPTAMTTTLERTTGVPRNVQQTVNANVVQKLEQVSRENASRK